MRHEELMIEDWVCHKDYPSIPIRVCGISKIISFVHSLLWDEDKSKYVRIERYSECDYDEIRPIPIIPEILEKIGFIKKDIFKDGEFWEYTYTQHDNAHDFYCKARFVESRGIDCCELSFYTYGILSCNVTSIKIRYVHELQHILKNCGIEKAIEL